MTNKLYMNFKKILKENISIIIAIIIVLLSFIHLPYYINAPGGITNLDKKIIIENEYKSKGSLNMAYVREYRANIFTILFALINPNFDIYKKEEYLATNDTYETMKFREDLELKESLDNAIILGYNLANEKITITSDDIYVTYIYELADTNILVGDKLIEVNGNKITSYKELRELISVLDVDTLVDIKVINNNKEYMRYAYIKEVDGTKLIGVHITHDKKYEVDRKVDFKIKRNESGPSGGFMMALEVYNELTLNDITKGYKIVGTGTIDEDGNVGTISGVKYKLKGAIKNKADIFFVPSGENYDEAIKEKEKNHYNIEIISVSRIEDALNYLASK